MATEQLPEDVLESIVRALEPEQLWLFGSRARGTHGPDSDWDLMAVLPDSASEELLDLPTVWQRLREARRYRIEIFPIRRRDFEDERQVLGALSEAVAREGRLLYGR